MYMLMSTMTEYASSCGASASVAGLIAGMYVMGGMVSRLFAGSGQAQYGWRSMALFFLGLHLLACCCYVLAEGMGSLMFIRFVHGLGFGAGSNAVLSIGTYVIPRTRYGEGIGYLLLPPTVSIAFGPLLGGFIYDCLGAEGCFWAGAFCSFLALLFIFFVDIPNGAMMASSSERATIGTQKGFNRFLETRAIPLSFCITFMAVGYVAVMSFYRLYAAETGLEREFSFFFVVYAAVLLVSRPVAGMMQDRFGDNLVCYPGLLTQAVGLFLMGWRPCLLTIVLCAAGCALGYGILSSCYSAIVSRNAPLHRRAFAMATIYLFCDMGIGLGPMLLGAAASVGGSYRVVYYSAAVLTLLVFPLYYRAWGRSSVRERVSGASSR